MPGNAAIYLPDPSIMGSRLFDQIEGIESYEGLEKDGMATGVRFILGAGEVTMNFMPDERIQPHLQGLAGFAQNVVSDKDILIYVQARIQYVRLVCGCVITPGFDEEGTIEAFLFRFNEASKGLLFFSNCLFDHNGDVLGGLHA